MDRRRSGYSSLFIALLLLSNAVAGTLASFQPPRKPRTSVSAIHDEEVGHFEKWLNQDVAYIITPEEKTIFRSLNTDLEREAFIEQFWRRRDPDPSTANCEYKEEHYRRIAYANQWFRSGKPGWMTDRGRIYILHGPPDGIESHPAGGPYQRPVHEGGGFTSTHPFEIWRYRRIEGMGDDVELEFVDPVGGGEYRLALNPDEKDVLRQVPGAGLTLSERRGLTRKADRPPPSFNALRAKDSPFDRYETYSRVQRPTNIKSTELTELVRLQVNYRDLPLKMRQDHFKLNRDQALTSFTLEISNRDLTYEPDAGSLTARVSVYGIVTSISRQVVAEFEDELVSAYKPRDMDRARATRSLYQKQISLDRRGRYRIDLVVRDLNSGKAGIVRRPVDPPSYPDDTLAASSLILSHDLRQVGGTPEAGRMFVLGDVRIHPSTDNTFTVGGPVGAYLQLYNAGLDQSVMAPSLRITYTILRKGAPVVAVVAEGDEAVFWYSDRRVVLIRPLPVRNLGPGRYDLEVEIHDQVRNQRLTLADHFRIVDSGPPPLRKQSATHSEKSPHP